MIYATINLLHRMLKGYIDSLESRLQDAERALDDAIAVNEAAAQEGDKEATDAIYDAVNDKQSVQAELKEAMTAMIDFQKHDWH